MRRAGTWDARWDHRTSADYFWLNHLTSVSNEREPPSCPPAQGPANFFCHCSSILRIIKAQTVSKQIKTLLQKQAAVKSGSQVHSLCLRLYHQRKLLWPISLTSFERWYPANFFFWGGEDIICLGTGVFYLSLSILLHYWFPHNSLIASHNCTQFLLTQEHPTLHSKSGRFFLSFSFYYLFKI